MENYQLLKTNVLLGGQMKYDLIINKNVAESLYITAISPNVPHNKHIVDPLLNYSHRENIKRFYEQISSSFYMDFVDPRLTSLYPVPNDFEGLATDTTYDSMCREIKPSNQIYGKQFEFLCPIWLEQLRPDSKLSFEFQLISKGDKLGKIIHSNTINFGEKLEKYFREYFQYLKIDEGKDWVFDINKKTCVVSGLNVETGIYKECKLYEFLTDLLGRERPLLEFNNMIINELNNNKLITCQLFNFNLCFNMEDIIGNKYILREVEKTGYDKFDINVCVCIGGNKLTVCDIFTNHDNIQRLTINTPKLSLNENDEIDISHELSNVNVLEYLQDYKFIDLIDKNKIVQNTCHWCLSENPIEHFNFYSGFSLVRRGGENDPNIYNISYFNGETANLNIEKLIGNCYPYWCNNYKIDNNDQKFEVILKGLLNIDNKYDSLYSRFNENCWVKNINYHSKLDRDENSENPINIDVLIFHIKYIEPIRRFISYFENWKSIQLLDQHETPINYFLFYNQQDQKIIIIHDGSEENIERSLYKNFIKDLEKLPKDQEDNIFTNLKKLIIYPNFKNRLTFQFTNGLKIVKADSPAIDSKEISYYKSSSNTSVIRNLGKIKPYFINSNSYFKNIKYRKLKFEETFSPLNSKSLIKYSNYADTLFEPKYPSIGYFAIKQIEEEIKE